MASRRRKAKAPAKATQSKAKTTKPHVKRTPLFPIAIAVIAGAIMFGLFAFWVVQQQKAPDALVTVNGKAITQQELAFQYNLLPESYRALFTEEQVFEQVIEETLVMQAAERAGFAATAEEINERVQRILAQNEITIAELQENLGSMNVTQEQFEKLIARQIMIEQYLNATLVVPTSDDAALMQLYEANKAAYAIPETVTVRHVLVSLQRTDAAIIAKGVYDAVKAGEDICGYAKNTSDDRGSRDTCGEYTFPKGFMVPEFEKASFEMVPGEVTLVQSQFGNHIIKKIRSNASGMKSFADVRGELAAEDASVQRSLSYRNLMNDLRAKATIIYADGTKILPVAEPPAMAAADEPKVVAPETPVEETPVEEVAEPAAPVVPSEPVAPTEPAVLAPEPSTPTNNENLYACIGAKSRLYGATWNTDTKDALEQFASHGVVLNVLYCDNEASACAGIKAFPTWEIAGTKYLGRMSITQMKDAASC
jgi:parvulin-like peptidyl-prolyl isomerase